MDNFVFPVLSAIVFVPIVAAVIILFMNGEQRDLIRGVAITAAATVLLLSGVVYFSYNAQVSSVVQTQDDILASGEMSPATRMFKEGLVSEELLFQPFP